MLVLNRGEGLNDHCNYKIDAYNGLKHIVISGWGKIFINIPQGSPNLGDIFICKIKVSNLIEDADNKILGCSQKKY